MTDRAATLAARPGPARVYLCGRGAQSGPAAEIRQRAEWERLLSPAWCVTYRAVWPSFARPGTLGEIEAFPAGLTAMCARVDGVALSLHPSGLIGSATLAVITAARRAVLPIIGRSAGAILTPLVDCRITPTATGGARIELPTVIRDRPTLRAALAAMGAAGVTA